MGIDMNIHDPVPLLRIEAWRGPDGWQWNSWQCVGTVPAEWCDKEPRKLLRELRKHGGIFPAPGACALEDDGHNIVIVKRGTREPIGAIAYGEAASDGVTS